MEEGEEDGGWEVRYGLERGGGRGHGLLVHVMHVDGHRLERERGEQTVGEERTDGRGFGMRCGTGASEPSSGGEAAVIGSAGSLPSRPMSLHRSVRWPVACTRCCLLARNRGRVD